MNQIVTTEPQSVLQNQQQIVQLPSDPMQLMALAEKLTNARLLPPQLQKSAADCWLVMSFCRNKGFDFFMVAPECYIVKGRLMLSGKLSTGLLNTSGYLNGRLNFEYEGKGDDLAVIVSGRLVNEAEPRTVRVELKNVRTENEMWRKQPEQQLAYAGGRIWGRRHTPELLMGLTFEGETIDVTPTEIRTHPAMSQEQRSTAIEHQVADAPKAAEPQVRHVPNVEQDAVPDVVSSAESANTQPHALSISEANSATAWSDWAKRLMAYIRYAPDVETINEWTNANADALVGLRNFDAAKYQALIDLIAKYIQRFGDDGT